MIGPPDLVVLGAAEPNAAATYAAVAAQRLGRAAGLLTTFASGAPGPDELHAISIETAAAPRLSAEHVPWPWLDTEILLAAPFGGEVDPAMLGRFSRSLVGVVAHGFLRRLNPDGDASTPTRHHADLSILPPAGALFLAENELPETQDGPRLPIGVTPIALSVGPLHGIRLWWQGRWRIISEDDSARREWPDGVIGALAAAFLVRLTETRSPILAAAFAATTIALLPTNASSLLGAIPTREAVDAAAQSS